MVIVLVMTGCAAPKRSAPPNVNTEVADAAPRVNTTEVSDAGPPVNTEVTADVGPTTLALESLRWRFG